MQTIRIATRRSKLALAQANAVAQALAEGQPEVTTELVPVTTTGDRQQSADAPPTSKADFVDALEAALAGGEAHLAVHSAKDVPVQLADAFPVSTFGQRADARDALVLRGPGGLHTLPAGATVGTSSLRRRALLRAHNHALATAPLRGNVDTRLKRLDAGDFDALLLACAGLDRLGLAGRISQRIDPAVMVPAPGQGAIAVQWAAAREEITALVMPHVIGSVEQAVAAERTLAQRLGADCAMPLGVYCHQRKDGASRLLAATANTDGSRCLRLELVGSDPEALVKDAAARLQALGVDDLLAEARA